MENYTNDFTGSTDAMSDLTYPDDHNFSQISWNNCIIPCQKIETLNAIQNLDNNVQEILNIYQNLSYDNDYELKEDYKNDKDVKLHSEKIKQFIESFQSMKDELHKQREKTLLSESKYKLNYDKLQNDIQKVSDFKEFAVSINIKYKDLETKTLNESILEITKKISDDNDTKDLKDDFLKQNYISNLYLYKFIREINSCNNGSTCSLCLQNNVDTFMEPCGHTGCSSCIEKLKEISGEYNCNCFLCRKNVIKFHKLYFT
jgi:hypothetical protein